MTNRRNGSTAKVAEPSMEAQAFTAAVGVAEASERPAGPPVVELSNGIRLKARPVPPLLLRQVLLRIPDPPVPTVWDEDREREIPNPDSPAYAEALKARDEAQYMAVADVALMLGTTVDYIPEGLFGPDDEGWVDVLEMLDLQVDMTKHGQRYLAWIRFYALERNEDIALAIAAPLSLIGMTEAEVQSAIESFRSPTGRGTDNGVPAPDGE